METWTVARLKRLVPDIYGFPVIIRVSAVTTCSGSSKCTATVHDEALIVYYPSKPHWGFFDVLGGVLDEVGVRDDAERMVLTALLAEADILPILIDEDILKREKEIRVKLKEKVNQLLSRITDKIEDTLADKYQGVQRHRSSWDNVVYLIEEKRFYPVPLLLDKITIKDVGNELRADAVLSLLPDLAPLAFSLLDAASIEPLSVGSVVLGPTYFSLPGYLAKKFILWLYGEAEKQLKEKDVAVIGKDIECTYDEDKETIICNAPEFTLEIRPDSASPFNIVEIIAAPLWLSEEEIKEKGSEILRDIVKRMFLLLKRYMVDSGYELEILQSSS